MTVGDSKTSYGGWQDTLTASLSTAATPWGSKNGGEAGATVAYAVTTLSAILTRIQTGPPYYFVAVLCNWGINDIDHPPLPDQATWTANYQTIVNTIVAAYPGAKFYIAKPWGRGWDTDCDTVAGWIDAFVAANPGVVYAGIDERVVVKGGDDGATMTVDGIHYSVAGKVAVAAAWKTALGL